MKWGWVQIFIYISVTFYRIRHREATFMIISSSTVENPICIVVSSFSPIPNKKQRTRIFNWFSFFRAIPSKAYLNICSWHYRKENTLSGSDELITNTFFHWAITVIYGNRLIHAREKKNFMCNGWRTDRTIEMVCDKLKIKIACVRRA